MNYEELGTLYYEEFWNKMRGRRFDDAVVSKKSKRWKIY